MNEKLQAIAYISRKALKDTRMGLARTSSAFATKFWLFSK